MKPRKNAFLIGSLALVAACTAQAAQIDVVTTLAPTNATVGSGVRGVRALTTSQTWTANNEYFLTDRVFVPNGITLTIEPGTKIYGSINDNGTPTNKADDKVGSLVAARGGRIVADGTAEEPITFTAVAVWEAENNTESPFDPDAVIGVAGNPNNGMPDNNDAGLWGGLVVLGNAYVCHADGTTGNNLGNTLIEGFVPGGTPDDEVPTDGLSDAAEYGFDAAYPRDDNDDSGVYRYITISHGGYEFDTGREINGLTLGGVGAGTVIDHIEVVANQDDGIEFFGGTVSTSHLFLAYNQDDNFDFDSGYTGTMQFFFSVQNPGFADGGFEHDGIENTTPTNSNPYDNSFTTVDTVAGNHVTKAGITLSKPRMFNGTLIGPGRSNSFTSIAAGAGQVLTEKGNHGFIYDDYYNGETYNSVIDDFSQDLAFFRDGAKSYGATADARNNTLGRFGSAVVTQVDTASLTPAPSVSSPANAPVVTTAGNLVVTVTSANVTGSPLATNVAVLVGDSREVVATKIAAALNLVPAIAGTPASPYIVGATGRDVAIASKTPGAAGQDNSLNIAIGVGTQVGITGPASSTNTLVGSNTSSVTIGQPLTYISGTNVRSLLMDVTGVPTGNNSAVNTNPQLTTYTRDVNNYLTAIDPRPAAGSPLLASNGATLQAGAPVPVNYRGAFGPGDDANWAGGWTRTWASGILQGGYSTPTPPFADADNDGISDTLEATSALTTLGFSAGVNNVSPTNLFDAIYTQSEILDLRTTAGVTVQKTNAPTNNVTLTVPVEKSDTLNPGSWIPAGNMTLGPFTGDPTKEFYRLEVQGAN
jgi:hypothetical protein